MIKNLLAVKHKRTLRSALKTWFISAKKITLHQIKLSLKI